MRLVIDANIAFSLLKKDSFTRRLSTVQENYSRI